MPSSIIGGGPPPPPFARLPYGTLAALAIKTQTEQPLAPGVSPQSTSVASASIVNPTANASRLVSRRPIFAQAGRRSLTAIAAVAAYSVSLATNGPPPRRAIQEQINQRASFRPGNISTGTRTAIVADAISTQVGLGGGGGKLFRPTSRRRVLAPGAPLAATVSVAVPETPLFFSSRLFRAQRVGLQAAPKTQQPRMDRTPLPAEEGAVIVGGGGGGKLFRPVSRRHVLAPGAPLAAYPAGISSQTSTGFKKNSPGCPCCVAASSPLSVNVKGCNSLNLQGATGSLIQGGSTIATGISDINGNISLGPVVGGTYTLQVADTGFSTYSATIVIPNAGINVILTPDASHVCNVNGCATSVPASLPGFDPISSFTLTYNATNGFWENCHSFTSPGYGTNPVICPPTTFPIHYRWDGSTCTISWPTIPNVIGNANPGCPDGSQSCGGYPWANMASQYLGDGANASGLTPTTFPTGTVCNVCTPYGVVLFGEDIDCIFTNCTGGVPGPTLYWGFGTDCRGTSPITFTIQGCNQLNLGGATVAVTDGSGFSVSGVTNASGLVTLNVKTPAWVTITISKTGFATGTFHANFAVLSNNAYSAQLLVGTGYRCIPGCVDPLSTTTAINVTDPNGTHTGLLTWDATTSKWIGCYLKVGVAGATVQGGACLAAQVSCPIAYAFDGANLTAYYPGCDNVSFVPTTAACPRGAGFTNEGSATATAVSITCPTAFSFTGNIVLPAGVGSLLNGTVTLG